MSQHDMVISNADGATVRADVNGGLQALASTSKGNARPATVYAGQHWLDDNTPSATVWSEYLYDGADDIRVGVFDVAANTFMLSSDGTNGVKAISGGAQVTGNLTTSGIVAPGNLNNYYLHYDTTNPLLNWDLSDFVLYDRTLNQEQHYIGAVYVGQWRASGLLVGTTDEAPHDNTGNNPGVALRRDTGQILAAAYQTTVLALNRTGNDGDIVNFWQEGTLEGSITVAGNTISYNAFCGSHWSQLDDGAQPEIPRGTVMSTIDAMCAWKSIEFELDAPMIGGRLVEETADVIVERDVPVTYTVDVEKDVPVAEEVAVETSRGERTIQITTLEKRIVAEERVRYERRQVTETVTRRRFEVTPGREPLRKRVPYTGAEKVGTVIEYAYGDVTVRATVVAEANNRLPKCKVSDVAGDRAVYGVFSHWDDGGDMNVMALGAYTIRIAKGQAVQVGDLIESDGTGCARVQGDDVVRSSTVAKVSSGTVVETYGDGSYLVPCTLMCG